MIMQLQERCGFLYVHSFFRKRSRWHYLQTSIHSINVLAKTFKSERIHRLWEKGRLQRVASFSKRGVWQNNNEQTSKQAHIQWNDHLQKALCYFLRLVEHFIFRCARCVLMLFMRNVFTCYVRFVFVTGILRVRALVTGHGSRIERLLPIRAES